MQVDLGQGEAVVVRGERLQPRARPWRRTAGTARRARRGRPARAAGAAGRCRSGRRPRPASRSRWARRSRPRSPSWRPARRPRRAANAAIASCFCRGRIWPCSSTSRNRRARRRAGARTRRWPRAPSSCLGLLDQRAHDERLAPGPQLLADALVGALALALRSSTTCVCDRLAPRAAARAGRDVQVAVLGERERARDRRGGHVQHVRRRISATLRVQRGALATPKRCCSSTTATAERAKLHVGLDQRVGADDQRQLAAGELAEDVRAPAAGVEPVSSAEPSRLPGAAPAAWRSAVRRASRWVPSAPPASPCSTARSIAYSATTVLPDPTSPISSRCIGCARRQVLVDLAHRRSWSAGERERQLAAPASARVSVAWHVAAPAPRRRCAARGGGAGSQLGEQQLLEGQPPAAGLRARCASLGKCIAAERRGAVGQALARPAGAAGRGSVTSAMRAACALHQREDLRWRRRPRWPDSARRRPAPRRPRSSARARRMVGHANPPRPSRAVEEQPGARRVAVHQPGLVEEVACIDPLSSRDRRLDQRAHARAGAPIARR